VLFLLDRVLQDLSTKSKPIDRHLLRKITLRGLHQDVGVAGAVYKPFVEIVPTVELPPTTPFPVQITASLFAPLTVAVNCCEPSVGIAACCGEIETTTLSRAAPPWACAAAELGITFRRRSAIPQVIRDFL